MSDPPLDFPDRRRFLRQTATGMIAWASIEPPDFDHVVTIPATGTAPSAKDLTGDTRIVFPDRKNVAVSACASRRS
jgi:hypothetical protein